MITKTSDEDAADIKKYTKNNDPVLVVTKCIALIYQNATA